MEFAAETAAWHLDRYIAGKNGLAEELAGTEREVGLWSLGRSPARREKRIARYHALSPLGLDGAFFSLLTAGNEIESEREKEREIVIRDYIINIHA